MMSAGAKCNKEAEKGARVGRGAGCNVLKGGQLRPHWEYSVAKKT